MKRINFNAGGGRLSVLFRFEGIMFASYIYTLYEAGSNNISDRKEGNNQNDDDDSYNLPLPAAHNNGRIIQLSTSLKGELTDEELNNPEKPKYKITAEVFQDGQSLGREADEGLLTNSLTDSLITIILRKNA
jgi:hypothetical protein